MNSARSDRKARSLDDREYAECFDAFKKISTEWTALSDWLKDDFLPSAPDRNSVRVMSVGSGTGDFDLVLMQILAAKIPHIAYTALDPNREHNRIFSGRYDSGPLRIDSLEIIPAAFGPDTARGPFDIIHLTHCLYYIPDRRAAIESAWRLLAPGGSLLIFHQTPLGVNEIQKAFLRRVKGDDKEMFSTLDIRNILEDLALPYTHDLLVSDLDVTDCLRENDAGRRLLSFMLECHSEDIEPALRGEIVAFIMETCRRVDGRYFLFHPGGIFRMIKEADVS